jgi:serine/threonine-protein kinase RsbW
MATAEIAPAGDSLADVGNGALAHVVLPANRGAPTSARTLLGLCLGALLDARALGDAQLLISELVTNSLLHGGLGERDSIVVGVRLRPEAVRLEVHNRGTNGTVAHRGGDVNRSDGFGLDIVTTLGERWGVERGEDTCVWVEMARA